MNLADVLMGLMALINLPVILILARPALDAMKDYSAQRKAGKNPVFKAKDIGLEGKTEYWQWTKEDAYASSFFVKIFRACSQ